MKRLFGDRLKRHLAEMFKYLRLVFNDHFVFALLILLGGLGLAYSNALKTIPANAWWGAPVTIVVLVFVLQLGGLATFLKDADVVFLMPTESQMPTYLRSAKRYSLVLGELVQLLGVFLLLPFMQVTMGLSAIQLGLLALVQVLLKDVWMERELLTRFQGQPGWLTMRGLVRFVWPLIVLVAGAYGNEWIALLLVVLSELAIRLQGRALSKRPLAWWQAIAIENNRMMRIYRFFNLFTTVPMLKGEVKRRRYLDFLLNGIKKTHSNAYLYLYSRGIIRSGEFSGLYFRLTLIGMVLLYFVHGVWLPILLTALFVYLIGFQLIPFYWQFDDIVFTHLYPISIRQKVASFKTILGTLMTLTSVLLLIVTAIVNFNWEVILLTAVVEAVEVVGIVLYYLPLRLRKNR